MTDKLATNLKYLDLSRENPEEVFDSIKSKIPDLCLPPAIRLAGEEDYFNKTKDIKLVSHKKQHNFDTYVSPGLSGDAGSHVCGSPLLFESTRPKTTTTDIELVVGQPRITNASFVSLQKEEVKQSRHGETKEETTSRHQRGLMDQCKNTTRIKLDARRRIQRRYSRIKVVKNVTTDDRIGFNKLLRVRPHPDYPFANPMPDCMLTDENIDNLREIIISSVNIEWKMLTPVRPEIEYDEIYFDKLIMLHRSRYKSRLDTGYYSSDNQKTPFKHTRHPFILQQRPNHKSAASLALGCRLRHNLSLIRGRNRAASRLNSSTLKLKIPTLMLTSDEQSYEPIGLNEEEKDVNKKATSGEDFGYHKYTRQYHKTRENLAKKQSESNDGQTSNTSLATSSYEDNRVASLDDQVEYIMNHLMDQHVASDVD